MSELGEWIKANRGVSAPQLAEALAARKVSSATLWQVAVQLASVHRFVEAARLGGRAFAATMHSSDVPILTALARLQDERGNAVAAEQLYRRLIIAAPDQFAHRLALARLLDRTGRTAVAIGLLEGGKGGSEADLPLAMLYLKAGQMEEARVSAQKILRRGEAGQVAQLAASFAQAHLAKGLRWLHAALAKTKEPAAQFALQSKFIDLATDEFPALARPMLARARAQAKAAPELFGPWLDLQARVAARLGIDERGVLLGEWNEGRGAALAGEKLIELFARTKQQRFLEETVVKF